MKRFQSRRGVITTRFSAHEVDLLTSLIVQLIELVSDGDPQRYAEAADPFEQLARDFEATDPEPAEEQDPVLRRLFPDPYPDDAPASAEFRRFSEHSLRTRKLAEAQLVLERLATTDGGANDVRIPREESDAWLRTLTSLRLAVATRLGITDPSAAAELAGLPDEDPRTFMVSVYDWLGFAQETLIEALA